MSTTAVVEGEDEVVNDGGGGQDSITAPIGKPNEESALGKGKSE